MIITTINDAQQQQQNSAKHPDGEEEPGSYVISELGWGSGRNVHGLVLNQTAAAAQRFNYKIYLPKGKR